MGWTPRGVQGAIDQQTQGDFKGTSALSKKMKTDAQFTSALNKRVQGLLRSDKQFVPFDHTPVNENYCKATEVIFWESIDDLSLKTFFESFVLFGMAVAFVEWYNVDGIFYSRFNPIDLEFVRYDQNLRVLKYQTEDQGEVEITPDNGNWVVLSEWKMGAVTGVVSQLATLWLAKQVLFNSMIDSSSQASTPLIVLTELADALGNGDEEDLFMLINEVLNQRNDGVLYLKGKEIDVVDTTGKFDSSKYTEMIEVIDRKYLVALLGSNLSTELASGGSYAAAMTHAGVEKNTMDSDAILLSTCLNKQLIFYITFFNFYTEDTPDIIWKIRPNISITEHSTAINTFFQAIITSQGSGYIIENVEELGELYGLVLAKDLTN